MKDEVNKWKLENKISAVITDNAANVVAVVRMTTWRHFPCFAHTLNLIVQDSLKSIEPQLRKDKTIVEYFKRSSSALAKLREMQIQLNCPGLKLKQDCPTRWNSTYDMLERILLLKNAVVSTLAIGNPGINSLQMDDWTIIEYSLNVFKIFDEITKEVSAEKFVTFSKIIVFVQAIRDHIQEVQHSELNDIPEISQLLRNIPNGIGERFKDVDSNELTTQATFLGLDSLNQDSIQH